MRRLSESACIEDGFIHTAAPPPKPGQHRLELLEPRLLLSGSISAQFVEVATPVEMFGYRTFDLQVTADRDWSFASLLIELDRGSIYQDSAGTDYKPNSALFGAYPTLEFDTYITANGNSLSVLDGAREIGGDDLQFDTHEVDITWLDLAKDDTGTFVVARVTVSENASGDLAMKMLGSGNDFDQWATFANGDLSDLTPAPKRDPNPEPPAPEPTVPVDNAIHVIEVDNSASLSGFKTYDIVVSTEGDWRIAGMLIELDKGSIYQDPMGSDTAPNAAMFSAYPALEFDSYVTSNGNPVTIIGHSADLGGTQLQFDESRIDVSWFDVQRDDVGVFSIARVTLSNNAAGQFGIRAYYGDFIHEETYDFTNGNLQLSSLPDPLPPAPPAAMAAEFVEVKNSKSLSGYKTYDLLVTSETDWQNASLELELSEGVIYQDPAGTNLAPNPATFEVFDTLKYDTYITANGRMTSILGGSDGDAESFGTSLLDITWSGPTTTDTGKLRLGRITVSKDAVGSLSLKVSSEDNEMTEAGYFSRGNLASMTSTPAPVTPDPGDTGDNQNNTPNDSQSEIIWLNTVNGELSVWQMNQTTVTNKTGALTGLGGDWCAIATGDLTGDGVADVLWRNRSNGQNLVTELDDAEITSETYIKQLRNHNWQVGGIGDFTGDGKADILWRHARNGRNVVWEMDGTTFVDATAIKTLKSSQWIIAGAADFDGDGETDILWRNLRNGCNSIWRMDDATFVHAEAVKANKTQQWQIAGVGDYTGDGRADILWRHLSTGSNSVWQMDGTTFADTITIDNLSDPNWQPAGTLLGLWEDINDDGARGGTTIGLGRGLHR